MTTQTTATTTTTTTTTTAATADDDADTGLDLTLEKDFWPVVSPVLDYLDTTVVKQFPVDRQLTERIAALDRQATQRDKAQTESGPRMRATLATYQKLVGQTVDSLRTIKKLESAADSQQNQQTATALQAERTRLQQLQSQAAEAHSTYTRLAGTYLGQVRDSGDLDMARKHGGTLLAIPDVSAIDPDKDTSQIEAFATIADVAFSGVTASVDALKTQLSDQDKASSLRRTELDKKRKTATEKSSGDRVHLANAIEQLRSRKKNADTVVAEHTRLTRVVDELEAKWEKEGPKPADDGTEPKTADDGTEPKLTTEQSALRKQLDEATAKLRKAEEKLVVYKRSVLSDLEQVRALAPTRSDQRIMLDQLNDAVRARMLAQDHEHVRKQLAKQSELMKVPGSSVSRNLQIELGVSYGVDEVADVSASYVQGLTWKVAHVANEWQASFHHSEKVKGKAKLGFEEAGFGVTAQAKGGAVFGATRTYKSVEDLVANEATILYLAAPLVKAPQDEKVAKAKVSRAKTTDYLRERSRLLATAWENQSGLEKRLRHAGALTADQKLTVTQPDALDVVTTTSTGLDVAVKGKATVAVTDALVAGGGGSLSYKRVESRSYKVFSYLDDVTETPVLQRLYATKHPAHLSFVDSTDGGSPTLVSGDSAVARLQEIDDQLDALVTVDAELEKEVTALRKRITESTGQDTSDLTKQLRERESARTRNIQAREDLGRALKDNLDQLRVEYNDYVRIANQVESGAIPAKSAADIRKSYQRSRGVEEGVAGAAEYVKAVSLQYAYLRRLYEKSAPDATVTSDVQVELDSFAADLKVPRIAIADKAYRKALELPADTAIKTVNTFGGSVDVLYGLKGGGDAQKVSSTVKRSVQATITHTDVPDSDRLSGTTAVLRFQVGQGTLGDNFMANLVSSKGIQRILGSKDGQAGTDPVDLGHAVADMRSAVAAIAEEGNTVELKLVRRLDQWMLVSAVSALTVDSYVGAKGKVPTPLVGLSVVGAVKTAKKTKSVQKQYFPASTLAALTNVYRARHAADAPDNHVKWDSFVTHSRLMDRLVARMASDESALTGDSDSESPFASLLAEIKKRSAKSENLRKEDLLGVTKASGVLNDTAGWLVDLISSGDPEHEKVARAFIEAYEMPSDDAEKKKARDAAMALALKDMVRAKTALEDASTIFRRKRGLHAGDINRYVAGQLADQAGLLDSTLPESGKPPSVPGKALDYEVIVGDDFVQNLKRRAIRHYADKKDDASLDLLKQAFALEYVAETFSDLTEFDEGLDKDKAIKMLGADLQKMLKEPRVYLGDKIDGRLVMTDDGLSIEPVIKRGKLPLVDSGTLNRELDRVVKDMKNGAVALTKSATVKVAVSSDTGPEVLDNVSAKYDKDKRAAYDAEIKRKAADWHKESWYGQMATEGRWAARHAWGARKRNKQTSISELLRKVLAERAKRMQLAQQRRKEQAKKATQASATT